MQIFFPKGSPRRAWLNRALFFVFGLSALFEPQIKAVSLTAKERENIKLDLRDLWKDTSQPMFRSIHHCATTTEASNAPGIGSTIFYHNLSKRRQILGDVLRKPQRALNIFHQDSAAELIENITAQSHDLGILLHYGGQRGPFTFSLNVPIHVGISHLWAPSDVQEQLASLFSRDEGLFTASQSAAIKKAITTIRSTGGLDDIRLSACTAWQAHPRVKYTVGAELLLPPSTLIHKVEPYAGLLEPAINNEPEYLDFVALVTELGGQTTTLASAYALRLFKLIQGANLKPHLGHRCLAGGPMAQLTASFGPVELNIFSRYTLLGAKTAYRTIHRTVSVEGAIDNNLPDDAGELAFEPREFKVLTHPGDIFNLNIETVYTPNSKWHLGIGYDVYTQNREKFEKIFTSPEIQNRLKLGSGETPRATQHRVFCSMARHGTFRSQQASIRGAYEFTIDRENADKGWVISLEGRVAF
jgi:hypothetical protein